MDAWQARDLAIVQGVGYPYPNRSHFRSIEIWDTASARQPDVERGLDRAGLQGARRPPEAGVDSIVVDTNALPSTGPALRTIVMQDAENFLRQAEGSGRTRAGTPAAIPRCAICWPCGRRSTPRPRG